MVPGQLIWGTLTEIETANPTFKKIGSHTLTHEPIADRAAADLYITTKNSNSWDVYSVVTSDSGDLRSFRSAVYLAGTLVIDPPDISFTSQKAESIVHWDFERLKIEAVAAPAELLGKNCGLSIVTDAEIYGAAWRGIPRSLSEK